MAAPLWKTIPCKISELCLERTLACGQSFRWKRDNARLDEWVGVIGNQVWRLRQTDTELMYQVIRSYDMSHDPNITMVKTEPHISIVKERRNNKTKDNKKLIKMNVMDKKDSIKQEISEDKSPILLMNEKEKDTKQSISESDILRDYFQLDVNLESLYKSWAKSDKNFEKISNQFAGIRIIRQDPVECLFSFICSSNNNISRITSMVDKLAVHYGRKILDMDGEEYYSFPRVTSLAVDGVEDKLRQLGFGYRAKYIQTSARYIESQGGDQWLYTLRSMEYKEAKQQLMKLCGVGAKVADCVSLFCLDKPGTIPVDTHVWQIAARDYMPKLKQAKSLTDKLYEEIGDHFRSLWGPYAGWAHSVLFTADLKQFKTEPGKSPKKTATKKTATKRKNIDKPRHQESVKCIKK